MMSYQERRNPEREINSGSHISLSSLIIDRRLQLETSDYSVTFGRRARTPAGQPPALPPVSRTTHSFEIVTLFPSSLVKVMVNFSL